MHGRGKVAASLSASQLQTAAALDLSLKHLMNENNSLRGAIDSLVKEKGAWQKQHEEAEAHIQQYRVFAQDLEKELHGRRMQQQQQADGADEARAKGLRENVPAWSPHDHCGMFSTAGLFEEDEEEGVFQQF